MKRPNVILITSDQHRGECLGINGNPIIHTPNLDALGRGGLNFINCYSPMPVCVPARYILMTGRLPLSWGQRENDGIIKKGVSTLPGILNEYGYHTALIGKAHFYGEKGECDALGIPEWRYKYGFQEMLLSEEGRQWMDGGDDYQQYLREQGWAGFERGHGIGNNDVRTSPSPLPEEHYQTSWCARESINWLRRHEQTTPEKPFFLWASFIKPHSPYDPPEPWDKMYSPFEMLMPIEGDMKGLTSWYGYLRKVYHWDSLSPQAILRARAHYYGMVSQIDHADGQMMNELKSMGLYDNTVIVFSADHGDMLGDHGLFFKSIFFKQSWQIPLIISAPGFCRKRSVERLASLPDVMPTILSLAGVPLQEPVHGADLLADLDEGSAAVFGSMGDTPNRRHAVRTKKWQYVYHENGGFEELYDIENDIEERNNLACHAGVVSMKNELKQRVEVWLRQIGDEGSLDSEDLFFRYSDRWERVAPIVTPLGLRPY